VFDTGFEAGPNLLWYDPTSGLLETWHYSLSGALTFTSRNDSKCGSADGCSNRWKILPSGIRTGSDVLFRDPVSGEITTWIVDRKGKVTSSPVLPDRCGSSNGCGTWKPVAVMGIGALGCSGVMCAHTYSALLWHDPVSGLLSPWLFGGTVPAQFPAGGVRQGNPVLSMTCGSSDTCSSQWSVVGTGDFNSDGQDDVLWFNPTLGTVGAWLLDGGTNVTGTLNLSWGCSTASGCASLWKPIAVGDYNHDGNTDLVWNRPDTGDVAAWLLDGHGTVIGTLSLMVGLCSGVVAQGPGCNGPWVPVGSTAPIVQSW
jgi:VCBS repeat protein